MGAGVHGVSGQPVGLTAPTGGAASALTQHPGMGVRSAGVLTWIPATVPVTSACTVSLLCPRGHISLPELPLPSPRGGGLAVDCVGPVQP